MYKVAIIGAGVVGAMTARRLSAYEGEIVILEKEQDVAMGQSKANQRYRPCWFRSGTGQP